MDEFAEPPTKKRKIVYTLDPDRWPRGLLPLDSLEEGLRILEMAMNIYWGQLKNKHLKLATLTDRFYAAVPSREMRLLENDNVIRDKYKMVLLMKEERERALLSAYEAVHLL